MNSGQIQTVTVQDKLPDQLIDALVTMGRKYHKLGVELFIFGSFAHGKNRTNSDLDIGIEWSDKRNVHLLNQLEKEVYDLPTIRKIDLVDFSRVGNQFRQVAGQHRLYLRFLQEEKA